MQPRNQTLPSSPICRGSWPTDLSSLSLSLLVCKMETICPLKGLGRLR